MNLVLFQPAEIDRPLPRSDRRAEHITRILRPDPGERFDVGLLNGPRGKARIIDAPPEHLELAFEWAAPHAPPPPTALLIGLPRPQTARDILRDATTLGATTLDFVATARSDPNYQSSSLWSSDEWQRQLATGAAQAFDTFVPEVCWTRDLSEGLATATARDSQLIALDVYGGHPHLTELTLPSPNADCTLCLGPERGWDDADRQALSAAGARFYGLGERVLRTETAVTVGLGLLNAARQRADK